MFLKIFITTLLFSSPAWAINHKLDLDISVIGHGLNYSFQYSSTKSSIRSNHINTKVKLTRCNQIFYALVAGDILDEKPFLKKYESKKDIKNSQRYSHIQYKSGSKKYLIKRESDLGQILLRVPSRIQIAQIAEKQKCSK